MSAGSATVPLTEVPGLTPPAGVTPNFNDPYSILNSLLAGVILCLTLATISIAIRLYTKLFLLKTHGLDDCKYTIVRILLDMCLIGCRHHVRRMGKMKPFQALRTHCRLILYQILLVVFCGIGYNVSTYGSGVHQWDVPVSKLEHWSRVSQNRVVLVHG